MQRLGADHRVKQAADLVLGERFGNTGRHSNALQLRCRVVWAFALNRQIAMEHPNRSELTRNR